MSMKLCRHNVFNHQHQNYNNTCLYTTTNSLRHLSSNLLLHSSNFPMVAHMDMKLGMYAYYIIPMTILCFHDDRILFEKASTNSLRHVSLKSLLRSSNSPMVARIEVGMYTYVLYHSHDNYMFPWRTHFVWKSLREFSLKPLLHSSNLVIVARMEVKLGAHVYCIVSMTTTTKNSLGHFSLKLLLHSSNSLTVPCMEMKLGAHVYYMVSMTITTTNSPGTFLQNYFFIPKTLQW